MFITSEFFIETYIGKEALPLLAAPQNIDSGLLAQYNTFISNISTIYSSQNTNGTIPVFYKNANGTPSSNSTLTALEPNKEYYFVSKSSASFPYTIPAIGGTISNPSPPQVCSSGLNPCCPTVFFPSDTITLSGPPENIYAYLSASVTGLIPGKTYNYIYDSITANWPSKISPLSGTITPASGVDNINGVFSFCPSTGCQDCLPFTLDCEPDKEIVKKNIYSILKLTISGPDSSNCPPISDSITVKCNQCLPAPDPISRPSLSFVGGPKLSLAANCCANPVPLVVNISGTKPGNAYGFSLEAWPSTVQMIPNSGTIGFGDGSGKISTIVNLNGESSAVIRCSLSDNELNETFMDFISIQCNTGC
jgi:hypothetical protein